MRHNLYDERRKEARKLQELVSGYYQEVESDPIWRGDYFIDWKPNERHTSHPEFEVAMSLKKYLPHPIVHGRTWVRFGKRLKQRNFVPEMLTNEFVYYKLRDHEVRITEEEFKQLDPRQQKFFSKYTADKHWAWSFGKDIEKYILKDRKGNHLYRLTMDVQFFFTPYLRKYKEKIKFARTRDLEKDYRKWEEKLYKTGFGLRYLFSEHHSHRYDHVPPENHRKLCRQLQSQISEGFEEYYEEKEGNQNGQLGKIVS